MDGILTGSRFRSFYEKLTRDEPDIRGFFDVAKDAVSEIAEEARIGKCVLYVNSPASPLKLTGTEENCVIYEDEERYDPEAEVRETYITNDWCVIQVEVYGIWDNVWTGEEEEEILFLTRVFYDSLARIRAGIVAKQTVISDQLTGALNYTGIVTLLNEQIRTKSLEEYTALYYNLRNFDYVNRQVGQRQGDKVLRDYSRMIREFLLEDELFGRMGGDSFFILCRSERLPEVTEHLKKRRMAVEIDKVSNEFDMSVRIGIYAVRPQDTAERIVEAARVAYMETRQPAGGEMVRFHDSMLERTMHDEEITSRFRKALRRREFVVYFQPKVGLSDNRLESCEALCRWMRGDEIVPPLDFIPTLERSGAICQLDFYVLERVCENLKDWMDRGIEPVKTSVNFSRAHILNRHLAERIRDVLSEHGTDPGLIEVEITEMSGYEDFEQLSEFVDAMKEFGIETSLDDFGTGYSSLSLIKDLNVDTIKLDKSFLASIDEAANNQDRSVIKNVISMVNELNMKVVAEGVETDTQKNFLKEINCQVAQGFLFDKPLPKDDFEKRLQGKRVY
ncbi:MAG: GGDEF domain-containing phosphodiesterase [Lachnospiraceae bacterium]|nr:GGDEF domain-containing phosphodiesterase [Lachnospiraceae bacterium]